MQVKLNGSKFDHPPTAPELGSALPGEGGGAVLGLIPSAQRLFWAAKQALGKAALGALFA